MNGGKNGEKRVSLGILMAWSRAQWKFKAHAGDKLMLFDWKIDSLSRMDSEVLRCH